MTVIIPSKTDANLAACLQAVYEHEPGVRVIAIDDGLQRLHDCKQIPGEKPFVFARNVNIGIRAAGDDDVVLLNDDALLKSPRGFTIMFDELRAHPDYGLCGATTNNVGNTNQWPQSHGFRFEPRMVCFVCVAIPRTTIERVGLLDERFVNYGFDDDDYCERVRRSGLKIGISDHCFVDHKHLTSTFRGMGHADMSHNQRIYAEKWAGR